MNIMKTQITEQGSIEQFLIRYKKWFIAALGLHMIPGLIFFSTVIGIIVYGYVGSDIRWHSYRPHIEAGYGAGLRDGNKDRGSLPRRTDYLDATPWEQYKMETTRIQERAAKERDEYLAQFPENERGAKRAEMSAQDIKLPLELELEKRFRHGRDFYTDYVAKKIKREDYANDKEHIEAMQTEGWKLGYAYGYGKGWFFNASSSSDYHW